MNIKRFLPRLRRCFDVLITALSTVLILWALQNFRASINDKLDEQSKRYITREQFSQLLKEELVKQRFVTPD
jgi:hypothetical protein